MGVNSPLGFDKIVSVCCPIVFLHEVYLNFRLAGSHTDGLGLAMRVDYAGDDRRISRTTFLLSHVPNYGSSFFSVWLTDGKSIDFTPLANNPFPPMSVYVL